MTRRYTPRGENMLSESTAMLLVHQPRCQRCQSWCHYEPKTDALLKHASWVCMLCGWEADAPDRYGAVRHP